MIQPVRRIDIQANLYISIPKTCSLGNRGGGNTRTKAANKRVANAETNMAVEGGKLLSSRFLSLDEQNTAAKEVPSLYTGKLQ